MRFKWLLILTFKKSADLSLDTLAFEHSRLRISYFTSSIKSDRSEAKNIIGPKTMLYPFNTWVIKNI